MGGGGYASARKLSQAISHGCYRVVANGVECEPGISCDRALLTHHQAEIELGLHILGSALAPTAPAAVSLHLAVGIEDSTSTPKPSQQADGIEYHYVDKAPGAGAETELCNRLFDLGLVGGDYPVQAQTLVFNVATVYAIARAVIAGEPLQQRVVSVAGVNYWIPMDLPISQVLAGSTRTGGHWTGQSNRPDARIGPATNALWPEQNLSDNANACINCGLCEPECPKGLDPAALWRSLQRPEATGAAQLQQRLTDLHIDDCLHCGLCDLVCPAQLELHQQFKTANRARAELRAQERAATRAKTRHARHQQREAARAEALQAKRAARLGTKRAW